MINTKLLQFFHFFLFQILKLYILHIHNSFFYCNFSTKRFCLFSYFVKSQKSSLPPFTVSLNRPLNTTTETHLLPTSPPTAEICVHISLFRATNTRHEIVKFEVAAKPSTRCQCLSLPIRLFSTTRSLLEFV